jgi:Tfp pilus assembly protein PilV
MMRRRAARGLTLIEVLISLALTIVGLLAVFATLSTASVASQSSSRLSQAEARARTILETVRLAPTPALDCLATTAATGWAACETTCLQNQTADGGASAAACIFTTASMSLLAGPPAGAGATSNQTVDRTGQPYALAYDGNDPTGARSTFVRKTGPSSRVYDIQVTIGWNDDGTATATNPKHAVTLRGGVFQ